MKRGSVLLVIVALLVGTLGAGCRCVSRKKLHRGAPVASQTPPPPQGEPSKGGPPKAPPSDDGWPRLRNVRWPRGCLIANVAMHPTMPWLAAACTGGRGGEVLLFDAEAGRMRSAAPIFGEGEFVGSEDANVMRWHPDGQRLAVNVATSGIALLRRGWFVGSAHPDETRDGAVRFVWVGDKLFSDTGALFEIKDGDRRFDFETTGAPPFEEIEYNAHIGAVVGRVDQGIAAFDPIGRRLVYRNDMTDRPENHRLEWSKDGRHCARIRWPRAHHEIDVFDGDDGRLTWSGSPSLELIRGASWSCDGALLVLTKEYVRGDAEAGKTHLDVVRNGQTTTIDLSPRNVQTWGSIPECSHGVAPSPSGEAVALLLDGQEIQIRDTRTGAAVTTFPAPAPAIPRGLPSHYRDGYTPRFGSPGDVLWVTPDRIARLAPHFVAFWSTDGKKIAEFVVPDR